jgi:hypothetical protein
MSKVGRGHGGFEINNHWNTDFTPDKYKKVLEDEAIVLIDGKPKVIKISLTDGINTKEGINAADYNKAKCNAYFDDDCDKGCGKGKKVGHHRKAAEAEAEEAARAEAEAQAKAEEEAKVAAEQAKIEEAKQATIKQEQIQEQRVQEERSNDIKDDSFKNEFRREDQEDAEQRTLLLKTEGIRKEINYNELNFKNFDIKNTKPKAVKSSHQVPVSNHANTNAVKTEFSDSSVQTSISHRDIEGELRKEQQKSA